MAKIAIVTVKNGSVECRDANGGLVRTIGGGNVKDAKMQGNGFTITRNSGQTELYDENGGLKRTW
ncbi:MAG: hypothetical protein LBC48_01205 [Dysgonamonadaceae bacterium]|jgi:hypothetical protein|nr:hypothetical protein [Dysgonamonadaceae bacterium]